MAQLQVLLNNVRLRGVVAGSLGGFLGWGLAEAIFGPPDAGETLWVGLLVGAGIGAILSAAEGLVIRSLLLARRGLLIGLAVGAAGGAIGAFVAQAGYAAAQLGPTPAARSASTDNGQEPSTGSLFSAQMQQRLKDAGAKTGEVEIGLLWENTNDLDLHVIDPGGERIYFMNKHARSGAELDVDRNADCTDPTTTPVEHVVWPTGTAPRGTYQIYVVHFANCGPSDPTPYTVEVLVDGERKTLQRSISYQPGRPEQHVYTFSRARGPTPPPPLLWALVSWVVSVVARIAGWTFFGALVGSAEGLTRRSVRGLINAALGGAIGGFFGGIAFEFLARLLLPLGFSDALGRLIGFVVLGACIGLFVVVIERALSAVITVRSGRHEGREVFLDKNEMRLGRMEVLDIYLGGDPEIAGHHATIRRDRGAHQIVAAEGPVLVNGAAIAAHPLNDGDLIQLGNTRLTYRRRAAGPTRITPSATPASAPVAASPAPRPAAPPPPPPPAKKAQAASREADSPSAAATKPAPPPTTPSRPPPPPPPKRK